MIQLKIVTKLYTDILRILLTKRTYRVILCPGQVTYTPPGKGEFGQVRLRRFWCFERSVAVSWQGRN